MYCLATSLCIETRLLLLNTDTCDLESKDYYSMKNHTHDVKFTRPCGDRPGYKANGKLKCRFSKFVRPN